MKELKHYLALPYTIEILPDEQGYVATIPDLPGCMSFGYTVHEALTGLEEVKELWLTGRLEAGEEIPEPTKIEDFSGKFVLRIPRSLHRRLDHEARKEGVSLNQYVLHLLSERHHVGASRDKNKPDADRLGSAREPGRSDWFKQARFRQVRVTAKGTTSAEALRTAGRRSAPRPSSR